MKDIVINKELFNNTLGLSCLENLLTYIFKANHYPYAYLYYQSYLSFSDTVHSFLKENKSFAYFNRIDRIQNLAMRDGLLEMHFDPPIEKMITDQNYYLCVMVKPEFIQKIYRTELWRGDHYILLAKKEGDFYSYLNDTPRDAGTLTEEEFREAYAGQAISIRIRKTIDQGTKERYLSELLDKLVLPASLEEPWRIQDVAVLRDILGIHRILRHRLYAFASLYLDVEFMQPYLNLLDHYYAAMEYMRLRGRNDISKMQEMMHTIAIQDEEQVTAVLRALSCTCV